MTYARRSTVSSPSKSIREPAKRHYHLPCMPPVTATLAVLLLLSALAVLVPTASEAAVTFTNGTSGPITVLPDYSAEYVVHCETPNVLWSAARTACAAKGDGWALATVPSATAQATIASFQAGRIFLAGSDLAVPDRWVWVEGRLGKQGVPFYEGLVNWTASACYLPPCAAPAGQYQHFPTYQPDNGQNYTYNLETVLEIFDSGKAGREWNDLPPTVARACYACERSPCTMALDCNTSNTQSVNTSKYVSVKDHASGSGGHCGCVCKDGFTGPRCDDVVPTVAVVLPPSSFSPFGGAAYSSEYRTDCSAQALSWTNARLACQAQGRGWDIATVPTANAQQALGNIIRDRTWLGGSDSVSEGTWVWRGGRLSGYTFYRGALNGATCVTAPCACESGFFCDFAATEPNNVLGVVEEDYLVATAPANGSTSAAWNDGPHDDGSVFCYACERSYCSLSADCNVTNTLSVNTSKYFVFGEACGCVCKEGFGGPRCDSALTTLTVNGAYVSQFMGECASQPVSWTDAASRCSTRGDGWNLATVNSAAVQAAVAALTPGMATWIGGNDLAAKDVYVWQYGRLKGQTFFTGRRNGTVCVAGSCSTSAGMYSNFNSVQPDDAAGAESYVVMFGGSKTWNDGPLFYSTTSCYICERSPCELALDCNATNTLSVNTSAFFRTGLPCGCVCREGFGGPRCDSALTSISVNGAYVSQFMGECASQPVSWTDAASRCSARGDGWALATVNSAAVQAAVAGLTPGMATWIGGNDLAANDVYVWQYGRLKGQTFYTGRKVSSVCSVGPCASPVGMYSNFNVAQPDDGGGTESYVVMFGGSKTWNDGPLFYGTTNCYICERSPCTLVLDCNATNTLSVNTSAFYTPGLPCGCVCKDGFSGPRCDDVAPVVDISGLYLSQLMAECQSRPVSWGDAAAACAAKGTGWALATIASPSAQTTIGALCSEAMWVGASDAASRSVWQWQFGRLKGTVFYQGARNSSTAACQTPPCACEAGAFCHWPATDPSTNNAEHFMEMSSASASAGTRAWNDAPALNSYTRCYACERSLCAEVKALALHSPEQLVQQAVAVAAAAASDGFFPNCTTATASIGESASRASGSASRSLSVSTERSASAPMTATPMVPPTTTPGPSTTTTTEAPATTTTTDMTTTTATTTTTHVTTTATTTAATTAAAAATSTSATATASSSTATPPPPPPTSTAGDVCAVPVSSAVVLQVVDGVVVGVTAAFPLPSAAAAALASQPPQPPWAPQWTPSGTVGSSTAPNNLLAATFLATAAPQTTCRIASPLPVSSGGQTVVSCAMPAFALPAALLTTTTTGTSSTATGSANTATSTPLPTARLNTTLALLTGTATWCELPLVLTLVVGPASSAVNAAALSAGATMSTGGALATTAYAVLCEPWAVEPLVLIGVLSGPCSPRPVQDTARLAVYVLNPFRALGPTAAGGLLLATVALVAVANMAAAVAMARKMAPRRTAPPPQPTTGAPTATQPAAPPGPGVMTQAAGRALFPRLSFAVAVAALPGVAWAAAAGIQRAPTDGPAVAVALLCAAFVAVVPCVGAVLVVRWAPAQYVPRPVDPQESWWRRLALPDGRWTSLDGHTAISHAWNVRGLTAGGGGAEMLLFVGGALLPAAVFAVTVAPPASTGCATRQYVAAAVFASSAAAVAMLRPHRALLTTVITVLILLCAAAATVAVGVMAPSAAAPLSSTNSAAAAVPAALATAAVVLSVARSLHAVLVVGRHDTHTTAGSEEEHVTVHDDEAVEQALTLNESEGAC